MKVKTESEVVQLCPTLSDPMDYYDETIPENTNPAGELHVSMQKTKLEVN